jgi:hypothetical protein
MTDYEGRRAVARLFVNPFKAKAHLSLGLWQLEAGNNERAHAQLGAALVFRCDLDEALYPRGVAASRLQRRADAGAGEVISLPSWSLGKNTSTWGKSGSRRGKESAGPGVTTSSTVFAPARRAAANTSASSDRSMSPDRRPFVPCP